MYQLLVLIPNGIEELKSTFENYVMESSDNDIKATIQIAKTDPEGTPFNPRPAF